MSKTEVFLDGQRAVIAKHLSGAKSYIVVAMAYFTDAGLFNLLTKKAQEGVRVQMIVRDDETNILSGIDYEKLNSLNGYFSYDKKVHHKFCIIDGLSVLSGSYNWTNQATRNHEDLTVITDDMDTAYRYYVHFFSIKTNINPITIKMVDGLKPDSETELKNLGQERRDRRTQRRTGISEKIAERLKKQRPDDGSNTQPS